MVKITRLLHGITSSDGHNENRWREDNKNSGNYDPRRIIEKGQLRDVLCRFPPLRVLILELGLFSQGKYEEEKSIKRKKGAKASFLCARNTEGGAFVTCEFGCCGASTFVTFRYM